MADDGKLVSVLLVEDMLTQAMLMQHQLKKAGFSVKLARNGQAAVDELDKAEYDIVLSDINMPGMDGYEVCRQAKANKPALPFVLLATPMEKVEIFKALECGADNFLLKAYDDVTFIERVNDILAMAKLRQGQTRSETIELPVFYDGQERTVKVSATASTDMLFSAFDMFLFEHKKHAGSKVESPT